MKKKYILRFSFLSLLILACILRRLFDLSEGFSEFYTLKIAPVFRVPLTLISSVFPFSLFESFVLILVLISIALLLSLFRYLIFRIIKKKGVFYFKTYFLILIFSLSYLVFTFVFSFDSCYSRKSIDEVIGLEKVEMNADNVFLALNNTLREISLLEEKVPHEYLAPTSLKKSFHELGVAIDEAADKAAEKYGFLQKHGAPAKPIAFSTPLSYTGISGIYGFFTGEANVNTNFADYTLPFTIAHEYSHQRGVGPENEAEFSALLICLESDDPYIRYSAYAQVAITLSNLLFEYDEELFYDALARYPNYFFNDVYFSAEAFERYSETIADEIASAINNTYLLSNGDEGVISYSLSAELYTAFMLK